MLLPNFLFHFQRLYHFYDPTQAVLRPAMYRMLRASREEYLEGYDIEVFEYFGGSYLTDKPKLPPLKN